MPEPPEFPPEVPPLSFKTPLWAGGDGPATKEEAEWSDLEKVRKTNDHRWLRAYGWITLIFTIAFALLFLVSLGVIAWHYLAHDCWTWLEPERVSKIQSLLFSGGMGAILSAAAKKQIDKG